MPEIHQPEDEAVLYVLGELTAAERRAFEMRLAQSSELRALVRELEQGALALSMTSPRRRPPREVWTRIEKTVAREARRKVVIPAFWSGWWRNGWAAAAACLIGWLLYALWVNRPGPSHASLASIPTSRDSQPDATVAVSHKAKTENATQPPSEDNAALHEALERLQAGAQEIGALHWQIAELTNRMAHLSQAVSEQQSLLSEPSRLKFLQLTPASADGTSATVTPVSTNLQRALVLAMARELGWVPSGSTTSTEAGRTQERQSNVSSSTLTNQTGVDFVDLRTGTNGVANPTGQSPVERKPADTSEPPALASTSTNAIPGFISGTNMFLAFDESVVSTGSRLTFLMANGWGQYESIGAAVLGNNSLVVTVPFATTTWDGGNDTTAIANLWTPDTRFGTRTWGGGNVAVIAETVAGSSNVFHFPTPGLVPP